MEINNGADLSAQTQEFQGFFNAEIQPKIDFANSCSERDQFGRPSKWHFATCTVEAVYFTTNENYNFNKFVIYGNV